MLSGKRELNRHGPGVLAAQQIFTCRYGTRRLTEDSRLKNWRRFRQLAVCTAAWLAVTGLVSNPLLAAECDVEPAVANLDFVLEDMHGNDVALSDYRGDVILLDFWATWCAPCRIEIPGFIEMLDAHGAKGFSVLGISIDDSPDALVAYAEELEMDYPVLVGDGRDDVKDAFGPLIGFPTTYLIDRDGTICHKHTGFVPKQRFVQEILGLLAEE
jgi:peroxiredoxin